jgi:uncharacterized membrane protein
MSDRAAETVVVKASLQRCFDVASDFESYPVWSRDVKKVDIVERDVEGRGTLVRFWAEAVGRTTQYTLRYDYSEAPARLSWTLIEGDIENRLDGEYVFESVSEPSNDSGDSEGSGDPGGRTSISYQLDVQLRVSMPGFVKRRVEDRILGAALQELKTRAES